jgi:DNA polymerase III alpha subunit
VYSQDEILYTWHLLENNLNKLLNNQLSTLPIWAKRRGYQQLDKLHEVYHSRLVYEFGVIKQMGFLGYFLIVADMIEFCRNSSIPTGPGRGSAAGALIAYLLKITEVDPIQYDLLFERFINPDRVSMPDADIDISQAARDLVRKYLVKKYGEDRVAAIATFNRMKVRAAIKDVVRSLNPCNDTGESFKLADKISKTLEEEEENITLSDAVSKNEEFKNYMERYSDIYRHTRKLEMLLRQTSTHAAGVLISANTLTSEIPLFVDKNESTVVAYDGKTCEALGYLKLDTLGLKNLDTIADCRKNIERTEGFVPEMTMIGIDIEPLEDPKQVEKRINQTDDLPTKLASRAYKYLREQSTLGIFQCEQNVTQSLLSRGEVNSIEEIADILALIRPGPRKAGSTEVYISRKRKEQEISYIYDLDPLADYLIKELDKYQGEQRIEVAKSLKEDVRKFLDAQTLNIQPVNNKIRWGDDINNKDDFLSYASIFCSYLVHLDSIINDADPKPFDVSTIKDVCHHTQGLPLFQEQLMQISVRCAGFTKGYSDVLRKAVGKKNAKLIKEVGEKFVAGLMSGNAELNKDGIDETTALFIWYKFVLPYGSYGFNCIDGDQLIQTTVGLVKMSEVANNFHNYKVLSYNLVHNRAFWTPISYGKCMGEKEVLSAKLANGTYIRATADHKFLTTHGEWLSLQQIVDNSRELIIPEGCDRIDQIRNILDDLYRQRIKYTDSPIIYFSMRWNRKLKQQFLLIEKQIDDLLEEEKHLLNGKIVEFQSLGVKKVYDIEVPKYHNFILENGTIAHNCSHSISYGKISFETAWLKANFPGAFYASLLSHEEDQNKINIIIKEAKRAGIKFALPSINHSTTNFHLIDPTTIMYSLTCMKGIGDSATNKIMAGRPYVSMIDFLGRSEANSKVVSTLIKAGAFNNAFKNDNVTNKNYFDFFEDAREKLNRQIDRLLREALRREYQPEQSEESDATYHKRMMAENQQYAQQYQQKSLEEIKNFTYNWEGPISVKRGSAQAVPRASGDERTEWTQVEQLEFEEQIFGTTLTGHWLDCYSDDEKRILYNLKVNNQTVIQFGTDLNRFSKNQEVYVFCRGTKFIIKRPYAKDPSSYTRFFEFEDRDDIMRLTIFQGDYDRICRVQFNPLKYLENMEKKKYVIKPVILLKCKINEYQGKKGLLISDVIKWVNRDQIKEAILAVKQKEFEDKK